MRAYSDSTSCSSCTAPGVDMPDGLLWCGCGAANNNHRSAVNVVVKRAKPRGGRARRFPKVIRHASQGGRSQRGLLLARVQSFINRSSYVADCWLDERGDGADPDLAAQMVRCPSVFRAHERAPHPHILDDSPTLDTRLA